MIAGSVQDAREWLGCSRIHLLAEKDNLALANLNMAIASLLRVQTTLSEELMSKMLKAGLKHN